MVLATVFSHFFEKSSFHVPSISPTQLLESVGLCVLFLWLRWLQGRGALRYPGRLLSFYLLAYAPLRMVIEFLRGDQTVWWAGLTLQQVISLGIAVVGAVMLTMSARGSRSAGA